MRGADTYAIAERKIGGVRYAAIIDINAVEAVVVNNCPAELCREKRRVVCRNGAVLQNCASSDASADVDLRHAVVDLDPADFAVAGEIRGKDHAYKFGCGFFIVVEDMKHVAVFKIIFRLGREL